jgi:hypothetical protein
LMQRVEFPPTTNALKDLSTRRARKRLLLMLNYRCMSKTMEPLPRVALGSQPYQGRESLAILQRHK